MAGKNVRLGFDVQKRDRYGRLLAYVYLLDGTFVNLELVRQGYAQGSSQIKFFEVLDSPACFLKELV